MRERPISALPRITPAYLAQLNARWDAIRAGGIVETALLISDRKDA